MLHPIVIPTIGVISYFLLIPTSFGSNQKLSVLGLIFITTYIIPVLILIVFKKLKLIQSFKTESIKERKTPILIMLVLFYFIGNTFNTITNLRDLGLLFYATSLGLILIYILFFFKIKTSIHLLSLGVTTGFFMVLGLIYSQAFTVVVIISLMLSGLLASSRLYLKAHSPNEVYLGFFIGFFAPYIVYYTL